jgi:hypothetical protein
MLVRACRPSLLARSGHSLIRPVRRFASEPENRILCRNIELAARAGDLARVRQLLGAADTVPSLAAEVQQSQQRSWRGRLETPIFLYLFLSSLVNAYVTVLGKRLVRSEADFIREQGASGEVSLEMVSFTPTASLKLRLDRPTDAAVTGDDASDGNEDDERRDGRLPDRPNEQTERSPAVLERLAVAVFDGGWVADRLGATDPLAPGGMLAEAAAAPDGLSANRTVPVMPMLYITDLLFGKSKWVLRCRVEEDGTMRWKSQIGIYTSEWVSRTIVVQGRPR